MGTFDDQLKNNSRVTAELLDKLDDKNYYSGRVIMPGDQVLFGLIRVETEKNGVDEINLEMIKFKESELDELYEIEERQQFIPVLKVLK